MTAFGPLLRSIRKAADLSQEDVALKLGLSQKHASRLECGDNAPTAEQVHEMVKVFDLKGTALRRFKVAAYLAPLSKEAREFLLSVIPHELH